MPASPMTLAALRTAVRRETDTVNNKHVTDAELNEWINNSAAELWDLLVMRYEDQFTVVGTTPSTVSSPIDLSDMGALFGGLSGQSFFFKLRKVDVYFDGFWRVLPVAQMREWDRYRLILASNPLAYTLIGSQLYILPETVAAQKYRIWYIPQYTPLVLDTDTLFDAVNRWHEFIVVDAGIKVKDKREEDVSVLAGRKAALVARINAAASNRDSGGVRHIVESSRHRDEG